jgi:peptide/nickel transport system substrate-binding protein
MPDYFRPDLASTYAYNPEKAKELIAAAGAQGLKIEFTSWPPDTELFGRPSVVVANQLNEVGLDVTIRPQPVAEWQQTRVDGTYQMFMDGNLYNHADPDFLNQYYYTGARIPAANRFSDPEMDALLDEGRATSDVAQRKEIYGQVQTKALDLMPLTQLFYREQGEATQKDVVGHEYLGSLGYLNSLLETWLDR